MMMPAANNQIPPVLGAMPKKTGRAPTLYAIIGFKFLKGVTLVMLALAFYVIPYGTLKEQLSLSFGQMQFDAATANELNGWLKLITSENLRMASVGSVIYGLFSWLEGFGLFIRATWAAWITIGESAMFVPIEVWQLERSFSISVLVILLLNIAVVWYLFANRHRLFHSHHSLHAH